MPLDGWMDKEIVIYMQIPVQRNRAIKKNETLPFAITWMDLEGIILNETGQTEKYKYHMISLICEI